MLDSTPHLHDTLSAQNPQGPKGFFSQFSREGSFTYFLIFALWTFLISGLVVWALSEAGHTNTTFISLAYVCIFILNLVTLFLYFYLSTKNMRKHQRLFREAFEFAPAGRMILDKKFKTLHVNLAFKHILECDNQPNFKMLKNKFLQSNDQVNFEKFEALIQLANEDKAGQNDIYILDLDGHKKWLQVNVLPVQGKMKTFQWRIEDITLRRKIEDKIREEQSQLSDYLNNAPIGFYSVDEEGYFIFINKVLATWLECDEKTLVQSSLRLHDFFVEDSNTYPPYGFTPTRESYQQGQVLMKGLNGRVFRAFLSQTLVENEEGQIIKTRSIVRDLTPEHEWQKALRISNERFEHFFQSAPIGIALINKEGLIEESNKAFCQITERLSVDLISTPLINLFDEKQRANLAQQLEQTSAGANISYPIEVSLNEDKYSIQLFAKSLEGSEINEGKKDLIVHIIDTTEQKKLEVQFAQSQKMQAIGQLAGGVAHDFNNLLTAMIGFCDLLLLRHVPGDPSYADLMQIKQNANRGATLVKQLLAFSKKQTLKIQQIDVTTVLTEISHLLARLIGEQVELTLYHGRNLGFIHVDQGQLEQVIINLVVNARDAMSKGGKLNIKTSPMTLKKTLKGKPDEVPAGDYVCVEVSDTGTGIPKEIIERIFDPFFSTKEIGAGTGLGLSTVYGNIHQIKGFVRVESEIDKGTRFLLYLPRFIEEDQKFAPLTSGSAEKSSAESQKKFYDLTGGETILLVEDEDPVRLFSSRALRNKGYIVLEAVNGESALSILEQEKDKIDLLISDVVMPMMDGPTLYKHVGKLKPELKFIFISGYTEDKFENEFENLNDIHFLSKPFTLKQLAEKVRDVLND